MKRLLIVALILALLVAPTVALAVSDISGARYYGVIRVSNNSTAETFVATTTGTSVNTTNLIAGGYLNAEADNCALRSSSGADLPFMPGYTPDGNPWCIWVNSIGADTYLSDILYTANSTGGELRYFPATGGMTTPDNDATLELGDNFTIEQKGWVNTSSYETLPFKDLTVDNWVDFGAGVGVNTVTERIEYNVVGGDHRSSFDWGTANISDTSWTLDFRFYPDTADPANAIFGFGLFDALGNMDVFPTDAIMMRIADGVDLGVRNIIGGAITDSAQITVALDTTYYVRLERTSVTETKLSVFSDSDRRTHVAGSPVTLAATNLLGGLRYIQASSYNTAPDASKGWFSFFGYNLVSKAGAFKTYISGTENITSSIIGGNSVTATGVSSGEYIVRTTTANYTDDFSVDLWTDVGAGVGVDITDSRMEWDVVDGLNIYSSMPIPTVSNISWELLFTYEVNTSGAGIMGVGLIETPVDFGSAAGDAIFMLLNNMKLYIRAWDGGASTSSAAINIAVDTTYYITLRRTSAIATGLWVYTDSARTVLLGAQAFAIPATIIGLDNLEVAGYNGAAVQTTGWIDDMTNPTQSFLRIFIDDSLEDVAFGASVTDTGSEWEFMVKDVMPYMEYQKIWIDGILRQHIVWEYGTLFTDLSVSGNPATPSFRSASSDNNVSAELISFLPISEAQAPDYVLGEAPDFIDPGITGNVTGNFTTAITPTAGAFPLAEVIIAIAEATDTPAQLPLLIIAAFVILAASLAVSATMRRYGSGSLIVKIMVIAGFMGIFVALGNFAIDFWMIVVFLVIAIALAFASRQLGWS